MSDDTTKIRIGMHSARELELDVADADEVISQLETATDRIVWITDSKGRRYGVVAEKLAFVEVDAPSRRQGVGF